MATTKIFSNISRLLAIPAALVVVALLNFYFFSTYPINIAAFDYPNYAGMIFSNVSNLIHASGYTFGARIALNAFGIPNGENIYNANWLNQLQLLHFSFHILTICACTFMCNRVFGKLPAILMCLGWGGNVFFLGGVNSIGPDWLQGDLLALYLLMVLWAYKIENRSKIVIYTISAAVITAAYLVKYNSLVVAPILVIILIFEKRHWLWKVTALSAAGMTSYVLVSVFINIYHFPSTGTRQLSYDHAWVLTASTPKKYIQKNPQDLGINTLRWRALSTILPQDYFRAAAYQSADWGAPVEVKAQYLEKYEYFMKASRNELIDFTSKNSLPEGYMMSISAIPAYYYIGLAPADALGIAVFKESLISEPLTYTKKLYSGWKELLTGKQIQTTPFISKSLDLEVGPDINANGDIKLSPPQGRIAQHLLYWNPAERAGYIGMKFFSTLNYLTPRSWLLSLLALVSCIAIIQTQNTRVIFSSAILIISTALLVCSSAMLLGVRFKEMLALLPILCIFLSVGISSCISWKKKAFTLKSLNLAGDAT
ncbi:hypothetical protein [Pseudomonas fluorescens group sp. PF-69]